MADRYLVTMDGGIRLSTSTMNVIVPIVAGHLRARRTIYCRMLTDTTVIASVKATDGVASATTTRHAVEIPNPTWVDTLVTRLNKEKLQ